MSKIHITSFLRPRGRYKSIEDQSQSTTTTASITTQTASDTALQEQQLEPATTTDLNKFELIPTLNFVAQQPTTTATVATQHAAAACEHGDSNNVEQIDNDSRHTYIINDTTAAISTAAAAAATSDTDTDEQLQQEVNFSLLSDVSSSFVDEPTSSISIVMDNSGKITTATETETTTTAATATTTDGVPAPTTTSSMRHSSRSAMTTITTPSSDQSIEEEIEEALEVSDEAQGTAEDSLELSEAVAFAAGNSKQQQLFGNLSDESRSDSAKQNALQEKSSPASDAQFKIDDNQLSGGKLAQHFVLDDDEDDDDDEVDFDDLDVSLPLEKRLVHSPHVASDLAAEESKDSLANESTAHDISDLLEEPRQGAEPEESSSADIDLPLPELTQDSNELLLETTAFNKSLEERSHEEHETASPTTELPVHDTHKPSQHTVSLMSGASSVHSEKDHSLEELVETNHSIEMTFDDKDLSSLHQSFDINNETLINRLLADTMEEEASSAQSAAVSAHQTVVSSKSNESGNTSAGKALKVGEPLESFTQSAAVGEHQATASNSNESDNTSGSKALNEVETLETTTQPAAVGEHQTIVASNINENDNASANKAMPAVETSESTSNNFDKQDIITDLDESTHEVQIHTALPIEQSTKTFEILNVSTKEANVVVNKSARALATLQLQPIAALTPAQTITLRPIELKRGENVNLGTSSGKTALAAEITSKQKVSTTPELQATAANEEEDDDNSLELMKLRILAMKLQPKEPNLLAGEVSTNAEQISVKQMERVPLGDFSKDLLEDITEESERNSLSTAEEQRSLSMEKSGSTAKSESRTLHADVAADSSESIVSLNMCKMLEQKISVLQNMLASKDACLAALNLQLESSQRRESLSGAVSAEQLGSGRDTSSLVTNSTEYRTFQEDFGAPTMDFYLELSKRDELIAKLTDSLQQSINVRENLQADSEKLNAEIHQLRKQLTDAMDTLRRPYWPRDQESNGGQRISEISMDLISESDDDLDRQFLTDNEDKVSRNSRERQLSMPRQMDLAMAEAENADWAQTPFSKQIEQFQKNLTLSEVHLFFMVQKKFDDYLCQELEKCRMKCEQEWKVTLDQLQSEKLEMHKEVQRLQQVQEDKDATHSKQMEDLRKYFEAKCADLEKQYSDDVFSHKSQHVNAESSSECASDQDQMPEEIAPIAAVRTRFKDTSPRKRTRAELLLSPSHRQMTPLGDAFAEYSKDDSGKICSEITDMKCFYQNKIRELQRANEEHFRKLSEKVKYYESRYPDDDFMSTMQVIDECNAVANSASIAAGLPAAIADANSSLIIIDQDELNLSNEAQVIQKIIQEYERRLQEQLMLAREDIVHELEQQIQTLLSETTTDDHHWPPELILLREKFTARSQLEIAQLQIKHEDEMSRLKIEYEKQLNRKNKRNLTFDSARDFDQLISERDNLRELTKSFRHVLAELARCVVNCEDDLNATLVDELQRLLASNHTLEEQQLQEADVTLNFSATLLNASLNSSRPVRLVPDVQSLLEVVEDPSLLQYISEKSGELTEDFDLKDCLERLRGEAAYLLQLSEDYAKRHKDARVSDSCESSGAEKNDSCCEAEDGLKISGQQHKFLRTHSLNEQQLSTYQPLKSTAQSHVLNSLPPDLNRVRTQHDSSTPGGNASELNFQVHELKNRLVKSETDRIKLQHELEHTISRNAELGEELQVLREQLSQLNSLNHTDYAEGYGLGSIKSPQRLSVADKCSSSFSQLQEKARNLLSTPSQQQSNNDATVTLLQMIEDFCREGDKVVEYNKKDREDLQSQIDTADKQLKATRQFLEEQATEREQERDEFVREIERLKAQLRDNEKERNTYANASEEFAQMETQLQEVTKQLQDSHAKRDKFEVELKASIDKIFVLREIISELETQVETKSLNEHVMAEKLKQLEDYINSQTRSNETLQSEVQSLKMEIGEGYQQRIHALEDKLQNMRPSAEQSMVLDQVVEQLRDIENTLDQKTKTLESLHNSTASSNSCSLSATEDVSVQGTRPFVGLATAVATNSPIHIGSPLHPSPRQHSLTMEGVQRIMDKLSKHSRVEEAAIKRIRDLEMQVTQMRTACVELQHERDSLQERMGEQTQRISALQSRLEEQRQRAEELQRAGTSDLNIRIHNLQTELQNLRETLSARDKQIGTMKQQLEKSKQAIDRLEAELAVEQQPDRSLTDRLQTELKQKTVEIQKLKDKVKTEMINKLALPDLMETMLADKNEEIDHLREQLESKEKELQELNGSQASEGGAKSAAKDEASTKLSARTLSDIHSITEFDEPDVARKAVVQQLDTPLLVPEGSGGFMYQTMETSKEAVANLTHRRIDDLSGFAPLQPMNTFEHPHYFQDPNVLLGSGQSGQTLTPVLVPRQINFSALTEDSKFKTPNLCQTPDNKSLSAEKEHIIKLDSEVTQLKSKLKELQSEKEHVQAEKEQEVRSLEEDLVATQLRLGGLQDQLEQQQNELLTLRVENEHYKNLQAQIAEKSTEIEKLLKEQEQLRVESKEQRAQLSKHEKNLLNYQENEEKYLKRIAELEKQILSSTEGEVAERDNLRKELRALSEVHEQCKHKLKDAEARKREVEQLNQELKTRDERLLTLTSKLALAEESVSALQQQICTLKREVEKLRQQLNSDNSSKQFSVDEIAQQVEKELNYSAQLDSNILKAIESEEENNLDLKQRHKESQTKTEPQGTDDENFTGERELLNQLELLRAQVAVEREQCTEIRQELLTEKQHSQEIQEQDVLIIEAMRKRLETALEQEDELHKQLDMERERCERLQTQLTALQRAESRRNSLLLLKSPNESPRKVARSLSDCDSELAERLRGEIKLLQAQNERERERCVDQQRSGERERQRYDTELHERIDYCEKLKREMEKLAREKDSAEQECEHLQERLTLQTQEIESLETRLATLQEAETRRSTRRDRQQKESTQMQAELQELRTQLLAADAERESLAKSVTNLRYDIERSAQREAKLAEALANAHANLKHAHSAESTVPQQFLQKMKEINALLAENTQENRQMADTVQFLVEERRQLQKKCEELESQVTGSVNVGELEERCNHLLGRYLRVESHRKALVYQKRYLKVSLQSYQDSEQRALASMCGGNNLQPQRNTKKLFKTVAVAIIAIQRMKYIGRIWHTGKRIVSKSVFTITQQKRSQPPVISCAAISSTSPTTIAAVGSATLPYHINNNNNNNNGTFKYLAPLQTPALLSDLSPISAGSTTNTFDWPRVPTQPQ